MAGKSTYLSNKVLDHTVGKAAYSMPTAYVGLYTAAPTDAGGGTEVTGGSYSRKSTSASDWSSAASGATSNANTITFVSATASWGTVTHFGLFDAASGGNLLWWGALTASKSIANGDTASFAAGQLSLTDD